MQKRPRASLFASLFGRATKTEKPAKAAAPFRPFQAISIFHGAACCDSAREIEGYRFLARRAPQLPLPECTMREVCQCRYVKHDDRRGSPRRLTEYGLSPTLFAGDERRKMKGRRGTDKKSR